jgi:AsmA protein
VFEGGLSVDTRSRVPAISLKGSATTIQLEPLLEALRGESMISGSGSFQLDLSGRGETIIANVQSAAGDVEFALRDGVVQGFNLGYALCRTYNTQRKLPPPRGNVPGTTRFTLLRGAAQVAQGIATSRNIQATSTFLTVNGRGGLDLAGQGLNYDLTAKLSGPIDIDGCDTMDDVIGQSIPLTLRGTISDPKIAPDFGRLLEQTIRRRVEEEIKDKLLERLGLPGPSTLPAGENGGQATTPR